MPDSLSDKELELLRENFYKTRNLDLNQNHAKKKTTFSFTEKELEMFRENPTLMTNFKNEYLPLKKGLNGDPNYESYIMPDGSINELYQERRALEFALEEPLMDNVPFYKIPPAIKYKGLRQIGFGWGFLIVVLATYIMAFVDLPMVIFAICFMLLLNYYGIKNILIGKFTMYVKFEGTIVDTQVYGFTKSNKYMITKISDGEKFLNIKLQVSPDMKPGLPITVYLPPNLLISASQYGPLAEYIIAYKLDISTEATDELLMSGNISADEYIRHDPISGEIRTKEEYYDGAISGYEDDVDTINNDEELEKISAEKE